MINKILEIKAKISALKKEQQDLEEEFLSNNLNSLKELEAKEYGCGTVNLEIDGHKVKIEVKKTVKWDNDLLSEKYKQLGADADKFIKCKYDVSEISYKGWKEEIKKYFEDARTVTPSKPTLTIVEE